MADRKSLVSTLWLASSLALLASVLVAPIRSSGFVAVSSRPDGPFSHFVLPPDQPTSHLDAATAIDAVLLVNDLRAEEDEEQDRADALGEPRVSFLIPCSLRIVPDRQSIAPRSILSLYPLRC